MKRPPIVVVVGHVDHGKTTLLDTIRKTTVAAKEAGGITQSIGAYEVVHKNERLTFIDTPGHEAFSKMRKRGAHIADVAILVVASDDGVQKQTKEAIKILEESKTPFVVAITKIDKNNGDVNRVKNELTQNNVLLEGYGGSVSWQGVSAKTGEGINELLDLILLTADVEGLVADPSKPGEGYIIEARCDDRKGIMVNVIVTDGVVRVGEEIVAGAARGKIRAIENQFGKRVQSLTSSTPCVVVGFETVPAIGEAFATGGVRSHTDVQTEIKVREPRATNGPSKEQKKMINIILKADVAGSLEALDAIIRAIPCPTDVATEIIEGSIAEVTDGDVQSAIAHKAMIVAFKTKITKPAATLARAQKVMILSADVVYDLVKALEELIKAGGAPKPLGVLEVLAIFGKKDNRKRIIGGKVLEGKITKGGVEIMRNNTKVGEGRIVNLQSQKKDVAEVVAGNECGMLFDVGVEVVVGDHFVARS